MQSRKNQYYPELKIIEYLNDLGDQIHLTRNVHTIAGLLETALICLPFINSAYFCFFNNDFNLLPVFARHCKQCRELFEKSKQPAAMPCRFRDQPGFRLLPLRGNSRLFGYFILSLKVAEEFAVYLPFIQHLMNLYIWKIEYQMKEWECQRLKIENELHFTKYKLIFDAAASLIIVVDKKGLIVDCNPGVAEVLGYNSEELLEKTYVSLFHPDSGARAEFTMAQTLTNGTSIINEYKMIRKDGQLIDVRVNSSSVENRESEITLCINIIEDITVRNRLFQQLELTKNIVENMPFGLYIYHLEEFTDDSTLRMIYANPVSGDLTGVQPESIIGKTLDESFPGLRAQGIPRQYAEVIRTRQPLIIDDMHYSDKRVRGADYYLKAFPLPGHHVGVAFEDITNRIRLEQELLRHRNLQQTLFNNMINGFAYQEIICDQEGKPADSLFLEVNKAFERIAGKTRDELIGQPLSRVYPALKKLNLDWINKFAAAATTGEPSRYEQYIEELQHWYSLSVYSNTKMHFAVIMEDITVKKTLQLELEQSNAFLQTIYENSAALIFVVDVNSAGLQVFAGLNRAMEKAVGLSRHDLTGRPPGSLASFMGEAAASCLTGHYETCTGTKQPVEVEILLGGQAEGTWWLVTITPLVNEQQQVYRLIGNCIDITQRKQTANTLKYMNSRLTQQKTELALLLKAARTILEYRDFKQEAVIIFNDCRQMIGAKAGYIALLSKTGTENEVLYLNPGEYVCTVDPSLPMPIRGLRELAYRKKKALYENRFQATPFTGYIPSGHVSLENVLFAPLMDKQNAVGLIGLANKPGGFTDDDLRIVTAFSELASVSLLNSRSLHRLKETEAQFLRLLESNVVGVIYVDHRGCVYQANEAFLRIIGYSAAELAAGAIHWKEITPPEYMEKNRQVSRFLVERETVKPFEQELCHKQGTRVPVLMGAFLIGEERTDYCAIVVDLSERKKIETEIRKSLKEKEILLQEIHHRVKNNLQIVSSLVGLQMLKIKDSRYLSAFEDIKNRIFTMALLHQLLYQTGDFSRIDMVRYIKDLTMYLGKAVKADLDKITFDIEIREVYMNLELAIPCGLIVNEIVSNSLKYAFPRNTGGTIDIRLYKTDCFNLEIGDTGRGLPPEIEMATSATLGLSLLEAFSQQLEGELRLSREGGTKYYITFPVPQESSEENRNE